MLKSLCIALLLSASLAHACPEPVKNVKVRGSSFKFYTFATNGGLRLRFGTTIIQTTDFANFVPGELKDQSGAVVGGTEKAGNKLYVFSVSGNPKKVNKDLPYLVATIDGNKASLEMVKKVNGRLKVVGTSQLESDGRTTRAPMPVGRAEPEMEGSHLASRGSGCGSGLDPTAFTARDYTEGTGTTTTE